MGLVRFFIFPSAISFVGMPLDFSGRDVVLPLWMEYIRVGLEGRKTMAAVSKEVYGVVVLSTGETNNLIDECEAV